MTASLHITPSRATSSNGLNLDGAKWYFYQTGTTTPQSVYTTAALSTPHSNPVVADAAGKFANIYFDTSQTYRGVLKTSDDATTIYDIDPINTDVFSSLAASDGSALVGFLQAGTGAVARTVESKLMDVLHVKDFGVVGDNSTDDTVALNAAFTAASGKTLEFTPGANIRVTGQIIIRGDATKIRGNGATINSYFAGEAVTYALIGGTRYPYNIAMDDLSINAYGVGAYALMVKTSYSTYKRVSVAMPAINVGGRGFVIPGDDTYGTGPYYNTFINCDAQSGSAGTDHIGFSLAAAAPNYRAPNANTFIGCRAGQCLKNFVIKGNGNGFYNPISEGAGAGAGIAFSFEGDTAINCIENYIFGAYIEGVPTAYSFNANSGSNYVHGGFTTGITTFVNDLGTGNYYITDLAPWKTPTGLKFSSTSSDANTLDYYAEGTWTPTPTGVTVNSGTPVWEGSYTRVGNIVTAHIKMTGGNITTVAASSRVTLPFTASQIEWGSFGNSGTTVLGGGVAAYGSDLYFAAALTASAVTASITFRV